MKSPLIKTVPLLTAGATLAVIASFLRKQTPAVPEGVVLEKDIVFGQGGDQALKLDIAYPKEKKRPLPALVFIHGGGWAAGSRDSFHGPLLSFAQMGMVCITVQYRFAPKHRFPAQVEDVKCAVRWLRANAKKYNVDPERIGAVGGSAGAHLAASLGTTNGDKRWEGRGGNPRESSAIHAMICMSGPYDLVMGYKNSVHQNPGEGKAIRDLLEGFLGGTPDTAKAQYRDASPITYASRNTVPALLTHGTADTLVLIEQSDAFYAKLKKAGASVDLMRIEGAGHADFGKKPEEVLARAVAFVKKELRV